MRVHLISYTARTNAGVVKGTARVESDRPRPSWRECAMVVPGYMRGQYVSLAPESDTFTVSYSRGMSRFTWRERTHAEMLRLAATIANRACEAGGIHSVSVRNSTGDDVTRSVPALSLL